MHEVILMIALVVMSISVLLCFIRLVIGPSISDRVVAIDLVGIHLIGIIGIIMMLQETHLYVEIMLVIGILSFLGSVALSKFIEGGVVIDRDRD